MLVADASVIAPFVADGADDGDRIRRRLRGESIAAPDLVRIEVISVLRRQRSLGTLTETEANRAVDDLLDLPMTTYPTGSLLRRAWTLRDNITPYDACYIALAETLGCVLLTKDPRLSRAPGTRCVIEIP